MFCNPTSRPGHADRTERPTRKSLKAPRASTATASQAPAAGARPAPVAGAHLALAVALCASCFFTACATAPRAYAATESFFFLADTHFGQPLQDSYGDARKALLRAAELKNLKAVCVAGDITDRGDAISYSEWEYLCDSIVGDAARIQVLGDHDTGKYGIYSDGFPHLTVANGLRNFKELNGGRLTTYHEFDNVGIMTLGGVSAKGHSVITGSMLKQLNARLLKTVRKGKVAVVVCHYAYDSGSLNMRKKLMGVLRSYPNVMFVSGHRHAYSSKAQCCLVKPSSSTTPYVRAGFKKSTKYPFRSIGVNACSRYRSGGDSFADSLHVTDGGAMTLRKWNTTKGRVERTWKFKQARSSVTIRSAASSASHSQSATFTYRVYFSDGGTYGGVKSGSAFSLKAGKAKKFSNIPAGVLVKIKAIGAAPGWSKPSTQALEMGTSSQVMRMKATYKAPRQLSGTTSLRPALT